MYGLYGLWMFATVFFVHLGIGCLEESSKPADIFTHGLVTERKENID
jgi:hypothetical protein